MTNITRRRLLGGAAIGAAALTACQTAKPAAYAGKVSFLHGVASGDPLADAVILWTRVTPDPSGQPVPVSWEVRRASDGVRVAGGEVMASPARDYCVKVDAAGLSPATEYSYRFTARTSAGEVNSPEGRTRTTAASGTAPVTVAIVSCSNWQFGLFNAYRALSAEPGLDAIIHLGDYFYEYGPDGYGSDVGPKMGRAHTPARETVSLADYRERHAQYKSDPDLQAAHAAAPWICTWDDHESTNNAYRTGAENHDPDKGEGDWTVRKTVAVQAYLEWMPVREPAAGRPREALWRSYRFGDIATIHALESRLTGRSDELSWSAALAGATTQAEVMARVGQTMAAIADPNRTMLGAAQEAWLASELKSSVASGAAWQVLANQTIMARVILPKFAEILTPEQLAAQDAPQVKAMIPFTALGLPYNLDAWDGFPAARERLYAAAREAGARLVTLTGDTHTAWANMLVDAAGGRRGVEFGCTSISSPGMGSYVKAVPDLGQKFVDANPNVTWHDPFGNGYTLVRLTADDVTATFRKIRTLTTPDASVTTVARYRAARTADGLTTLAPV